MADDTPATDTPDVTGLSDAELRALGTRARESGDDALRRLVASYISLRTIAAETVTFIEAREGAVTILRTPIFQRLRDLTTRRPT